MAATRRYHRRANRREKATGLEAPVSELEPGALYHFRLVGENVHGKSYGADQTFNTNDKPTILNDTVAQVNTDGAVLQAEINANALETSYHFEYGPEPCSISACTSSPTGMLFDNLVPKPVSLQRSGLSPGETIYFRVVATQRARNDYRRRPSLHDLRRRLRRRPLPELAGAPADRPPRCCSTAAPTSWSRLPNAGGYDVESDLVPGQQAAGRLPGRSATASSTRCTTGSIPGIAGNPTNLGRDPYVATRGADGWTTRYVGLPANGIDPGRRLRLAAARRRRRSLDVFAFGGTRHLRPLLRRRLDQHPAAARRRQPGPGHGRDPQPRRRRRPPATSRSRSRPTARTSSSARPPNSSRSARRGNVSIYDRDLAAGTTQVVSTHHRRRDDDRRRHRRARHLRRRLADRGRQARSPPTPTGNDYWHLYMHVGTTTAIGRPHAGLDDGRPLRRHDLRRVEGLLHDHGQTARAATPTRAPTSTRPTSAPAGPRC